MFTVDGAGASIKKLTTQKMESEEPTSAVAPQS